MNMPLRTIPVLPLYFIVVVLYFVVFVIAMIADKIAGKDHTGVLFNL